MRILQLISSYGFFGSENVVLEHAVELDKRGIDNTIGVFENSHNPHIELYERAVEAGLKAVVFRCRGKADISAVRAIMGYVRSEDVDLIHSHGYKSNIYGFAAARFLARPIVSTCHNWIAADLKTRFYYMIEKRILPYFSKVVAVSEAIEKELHAIGVGPEKVELIFNGVGTEKFRVSDRSLRAELGIGPETKVVGSVSRLSDEKGLDLLIQAAAAAAESFPEAVFVIVGDGPARGALEDKARALGLKEKVIFTGIRTDMARVYAAFDIFVLPSLMEGLPMVLLEAMAAARPVLATSVGAIPRVVEDGRDGLLIPAGDAGAIGEGLCRLLGDGGLAGRLGRSARKRVEEGFSSSHMSSRYVEVYEESLGSGKARRGRAGQAAEARHERPEGRA